MWVHNCKRDESIMGDKQHERRWDIDSYKCDESIMGIEQYGSRWESIATNVTRALGSIAADVTREWELMKSKEADDPNFRLTHISIAFFCAT